MSTQGFEHLRVLIVEDNLHMRGLLRSLLATLDIHNPMDAANGNVALELLQDRKCDLILTDLAMKPMDGIEFTRQVRNGKNSPNPYVPIIMITGHTEMHHVRAARDAGITEFMAKPITAQALFTHIAQIVERPRPFVRCEGYFGPDRRRRHWENYAGPWRRAGDFQIVKSP